ncbi:MAG: hypothetical protein WA012_04215, partial [Rhodoferax sp.]|uniref:hypothetical protein n=1 Tax=Rhodoferax sp. TaxID=50421 RepID=UPI003BB76A3F
TQSEIPCGFHIYSPFQSSSTLIFNAEADRLEAGGFNLVMDIKEHHASCHSSIRCSLAERVALFLRLHDTDHSVLCRYRPPISTCKPPPRKSLISLEVAL